MNATKAFAAQHARDALTPFSFDRREPGPHDVVIEISHCGVCHTDWHFVNNDFGMSLYPMVPGHEIVGTVRRVGSDVSGFAAGDGVGVGCLVDSCRECNSCHEGSEQHCENGFTLTYSGLERDGKTVTQGGYSTSIVVDERFVLRLPATLAPERAAPLLCAGITTYSPLRRWGAGPGRKVAVVGLGGLGHMAVQLAHAMGAEVTVLSQSLKKQEDGLRLGADRYYATRDETTFTQLAGYFDLIINTVSASIDISAHLGLLTVDGAMVNVGAPAEPLPVNAMALIGGRRSFAGSMIGGIPETQEMLDFCAKHGIGAEIELIPADKINDAYERVLSSDVRYRFVIDTATLV
jgi:alcohol dehydrogenase (NADP+)